MYYNFIKMHGCGNDYIYFDNLNGAEIDVSALFWLCDRHKGIGSDGIVLILPSDAADARMKMFNADGSEGLMCGNAIRCVAEYLYTNGHTGNEMTIETASGIKRITQAREGMWTVDMGKVTLEPEKEIEINGTKYMYTKVDVGNPHAVVFVDDVDNFDVEGIGKQFESHEVFAPHRTNTEFVQIIAKNRLKMRVWERGSGETLACGTGACATAAAAIQKGHATEATNIKVDLTGGQLTINHTQTRTLMTGEAKEVFTGKIFL